MGPKLVVGLGNPGSRYERTRHNMGFMAVDRLVERLGGRFRQTRFGLTAEVGGLWVLKPQTFMNLSGQAVAPFARYYKITADEILVVVDDMDLPLGTLRLRGHGSSGGHNGLKSCIQHLGTEDFPRLKLGISRPPEPITVIDWVLMRFAAAEEASVDDVLNRAAAVIENLPKEGLERTMSRFNG